MTQPHYHAIYLAPHLDDVVLSCGGQIFEDARRGKTALVVTLMAGDPPAGLSDYVQSLHDRWQLQRDTTAVRRREDLAACAILQADALHGTVPDCIYRVDPATGTPMYQSDDDIFGKIHPADRHALDAVAAQLATLPLAERVIAPLTVGHHVDHQLVRQAAEARFGHSLEYYEDFPYVQTPGSLNFLQKFAAENWQSSVLPVGDDALRARVKAIVAYRSQLSTFFADLADLERQVFGYARTVGGERLWQRLPD
jgi:LmbE family N-acetylglucosaminyl deacetylase